jgi:hypothetical protein
VDKRHQTFYGPNTSNLFSKEYVPVKERQAASDTLMSLLADALSEKELKEFGGTDGYTKRSLDEYVDEEDEDLDYED